MSQRTHHTPPTVCAPPSAFQHGVAITDATTWLHVSGQIGQTLEGEVAGDSEAQMEMCWNRIFAILADAGMDKSNIVKVTAFLTRPEDIGLYRTVRDRLMDGHEAASTLLIVAGLAHPDWTVEIEAIAAK